MPHDDFDPFNDRLSRDIRNSLSESFVDSMAQMQPYAYQTAADKWLTAKPAAGVRYRTYIRDRLRRYDRVMQEIKAVHLTDALLQSLVIWNDGLFFEFHDHLERIWQKTTGDENKALRALIKAAGVYIHMEYDHPQAAESLAAKSFNQMLRYSHCLTFITNLDVFAEKIKNLDPVSPKLENPALGVIWNRLSSTPSPD